MLSPITFRLFLGIVLSLAGMLGEVWGQSLNPNHSVGTVTGVYNYAYNQTPAQLVEIYVAGTPNTGFTYLWESSVSPVTGFATAPGAATTSAYNPAALTQTTYYRRKSTHAALGTIYSNTIKLTVVSATWEDINYIREHDLLTTGITTWTAIDGLAIGLKLQTTTYIDGLGRSIEKVSRETATPASGTLWGDMVQFSKYDIMGREPQKYLPYTTLSQSGKYKTAPLTEQPVYYTNTYNETSAFSTITFDNSPLNRIKNVKEPGTAWAASAGSSVIYDVNTPADNVKYFKVDYVQGNPPGNSLAYPDKTLYKVTYTDVNGKMVVEYTNKSGQLILKKVQIDAVPTAAHVGWICTYSIYDDFGLLRYQLQPEAVKYLDANGWSFAGTSGQQVLKDFCFQYNYDDKGRTIWKKAPGAEPLNMIYDSRDRVVFMQDGNQFIKSTPEWTANLYDELDRLTVTTLYKTAKTSAQLQADITNSVIISTVNIVNPNQPFNDLIVSTRVTTIPTYTARNSIEFTPGFESAANDDFVAEINATASQSITVTTAAYKNPISSADLNNAAVTTVLKYQFYDNYSFPQVKTFNTGYTNLTAYSTSDANVIPLATSKRTVNMPTGSMTRVLGSSNFLAATQYYDEKGNAIQTLEDNIKTGMDITTLQYHFAGRVLSTCTDHTTSATGYTNFKTLTKYLFDKIGRVTSTQKQYDANPLKTVSTYDYDDMGRVKTKHLDPGYTGGGNAELESLNYTFNLHNNITGINKDYALKAPATYNKWEHSFGMYLGYDNRDNVFTKAELNSQVTGIAWNTQGDDAQRRYDYTYDNAGRLTKALFTEKQHPGDSWINTKTDFSVTGTSGQITYDLNGNLLTMLHKGVRPGTPAPLTVDDLRYTYTSLSNKLESVADLMTTTAVNGQFGDLKDGTNGASPDYVYDVNGNLVIDLNKNIQSVNGGAAGTNGIVYNHLDKPELIRVVGKGTVRIVYSADGEKLQRAFIPEAGGPSAVTTYINEYVYQETATITTTTPAPLGAAPTLSFINFEEGRVRVMTPLSQDNGYDVINENGNITLPNNKSGAWDYFIMDYQQNVRMILTEETHTAGNTCTMESTRASVEEPIFGQLTGNEVAGTRIGKPPAWTGNTTASVSRLGNIALKNIGPNVLEKVMAGDKVSATVDYYYASATGGDNSGMVSTILGSIIGAIGGGNEAGGLVKGGTTGINTDLGGNTGFINAVKPTGSGGTTPQAYLTILFFDERFNFISAADGGVAQSQVASSVTAAGAQLSQLNIKAPKNGYVYAYLSNRSDQHVYFDQFKVTIVTGNIIEENHYYAYGLKIAGISSRKLPDANEGVIKNNHFYNDKELWDDADLNWYDYGFRNYDPQIGRFTQLDPLTDDYPYYTPYQYAGCEPIANVDIDGLEPWKVLNIVTVTAKAAPKVAGQALSLASKIGLFAKGVGIGINIATNWINQNINPVYGVFNGINSQFTHQDFLTGKPMTHREGALDAALSIVPGGKSAKAGIGLMAIKRTAAMGAKVTKILNSASLAYKGSTILGHALSKHAGRNPNIWGKLTGNPSTWHNQGLRHFNDIMDAPGKFLIKPNPEGIKFLEKMLPDGRGIRLNMDETFKGFID